MSENISNIGPAVLDTDLPDIGSQARWSVSSYKFGFNADCLRDGDPETFWHSDGPQPHHVTLHFPKKVAIQRLAIHLNFAADDSYTPSRLCIRAGTGLNDLQDVRLIALDKPNGWIVFDVSAEPTDDGEGLSIGSKALNAYVIQVVVLTNHMNGKDTHIRGLRVLGPPEDEINDDDLVPFTSLRFKMHETIR